MSSPGSSSDTSPRNLLTTYPATSAWSSALSSAVVPKKEVKTPPRSMSPTTTTGSRAARARAEHGIVPVAQLLQAADDGLQQGLPPPVVVPARAYLADRLAEQHDLAAAVAAR